MKIIYIIYSVVGWYVGMVVCDGGIMLFYILLLLLLLLLLLVLVLLVLVLLSLYRLNI